MFTNEKSNNLRVLVISNNPFSEHSNNGKTLASFFKKIPKENIAQLYFKEEIPFENACGNYYKITDQEMLTSLKGRRVINGRVSIPYPINTPNDKSVSNKPIKRNNFTRLARELIWKTKKWDTRHLWEWLDEFKPNIVFFTAGDSLFAYDIVNIIVEKYNTKKVVYITDDYILPRFNLSPFWWTRRFLIEKKMKRTIKESDLFITISNEMKDIYFKKFKKDSFLLMNVSESMKIKKNKKLKKDNEHIRLIYAGGLHYKRHESLYLISKAIEEINKKTLGLKVILDIYSFSNISEKIIQKIERADTVKFRGGLNAVQLKKELNSSDILVHVESFDRKSTASTRLSISTKIPEYLSVGKPILAVGPSNISSMNYLNNCALCINNPFMIEAKLYSFLLDNVRQKELAKKSLSVYNEVHNPDKIIEMFTEKLHSLIK